MIARLRSMWFDINASYWFYPALFAAGALLLALLLVHVDRIGAAQSLSAWSAISPARPDGASNMLTVLAGSMIGVASTVFSITIAAVAYASGTYGPRILTNFMEDKGNQLSLATFIGTFVYSITVLRAVRSEDEASLFVADATATSAPGFVPQLSLLVAFGLMIVAVAVLVYFLHHIPSSIRINTVIEQIGGGVIDAIPRRFPEEGEAEPAGHEPSVGAHIDARRTGYVRVIDFDGLRSAAKEHSIRLWLRVRTGDFIYPGKPLAGADTGDLPDEARDAVADCFAVGASRTPEQDIEFPIDELVEIALRALSPGINDPFTAITAVHWLSAATIALGRRSLVNREAEPQGEERRVFPLRDGFAHYLERGFGAARSALASNRLAALVTLDSLCAAAGSVEGEARHELVRREAARFIEQAGLSLAGPDLDDVRARYRTAFPEAST
ncbi:hypothetical protein B2G71_06645 [Novosphingobium sp. PC22D]|uniref:DUF2254 domain-containing protein n=1 Tax=Novosphingobium sp. PC22D TaxID=1962403 RepID=UPI000BF1C046|nr:DUF2254 domain-containing protein [Novosphingobium sp. PC22D]PEQ13969.1 hypothetical protein B2G71_06645 [Novosphingobium sp. PC22D]